MPRSVFYLYLIPLAISVLVGLRAYRAGWPRPYKQFALFLLATLCTEILAISWKLWLYNIGPWHFSKMNVWVYDLYYIPEYLFFFWFYFRALEPNAKQQLAIKIMAVIFTVGALINLLFIQGISKLDTFTIVGGNLGILLCTLAYFRQELRRSQPMIASRDPLFWISVGAFIFNSATLPYFVFINYLSRTNIRLAIALFNIILLLNIAMYIFYLIAFLCSKPRLLKLS